MSLRFTALLASVAALLGVMLAVVTGHVVAAARDWSDASFGMSDHASVLVVTEAAGSEDASAVNQEALSVLAGSETTVVFEADDAELGMGLFDSAGRFAAVTEPAGQAWDQDASAAADVVALVRADSYLVGREGSYLPDGVRVVGYYDPSSAPVSSEYVYTLFRQQTVTGTYFIESVDPDLAGRIAGVFSRHGYAAALAPLDVSVWSVIRSEPLSYAYLASLLLVLGTVILLCASWGAQNRRRFLIHRKFGAHSGSYARRLLLIVVPAVLTGTASGITAGWFALAALDSLSDLPNAMSLSVVGLGSSTVLIGIFTATVTLQTRRWSSR